MAIVLPDAFHQADAVSFFFHDFILQSLISGRQQELFMVTVPIDESDELKNIPPESLHSWMISKGRRSEADELVFRVTFQAILSDMCHFLYESLDCSRKGKLTVAYALLRKPFAESLFHLENMLLDRVTFLQRLEDDPLQLRVKLVDLTGHENRIRAVLQQIGGFRVYDARFIARLRYDKSDDDSFNGVCDQALHLITERKSIKTESLNLNFIFSDTQTDAIMSQWEYFYARLPYLMSYCRDIVDALFAKMVKTEPSYLQAADTIASAGLYLWASNLVEPYKHLAIDDLGMKCREFLDRIAHERGTVLTEGTITRIFKKRKWPGIPFDLWTDEKYRTYLKRFRTPIKSHGRE